MGEDIRGSSPAPERTGVKCVVWDLDDTVWRGTLLEGDAVVLLPGVRETILELDARGILHSIASKNEHDAAWRQLTAFGLDEFFVVPRIGWGNKSDSVRDIAEALGIGLDTVVLIDDQAFERDEVRFSLPDVRTIDPAEIAGLLNAPAFRPRFVTDESRLRRRMYQSDFRRKQNEEVFPGTRDEFLATLGMIMTIRLAGEQDLHRAEELTVRTNQLNTNGRTYSYEELRALLGSRHHRLLVASLEDRYGPSGTIGLALVEFGEDAWVLKLLITSCRVISRGAGGILLTNILQAARAAGARLRAVFVPNERNRLMYVTYKFNGFHEVSSDEAGILLEHPLDLVRPFPPHVTVHVQDWWGDRGSA